MNHCTHASARLRPLEIAIAAILFAVFAPRRDAVVRAFPPQIVRWKLEATVTYIVDPLGLFPDVRLGDPVRGMVKFDLTVPPITHLSTAYEHDFNYVTWIEVVRMIIENPRSGTEFAFLTDVDGDSADVFVFNDYPDDDAPFDAVYASQSVFAPAGYQGPNPVMSFVLEGPTDVFPTAPHFPTLSDRPPGEINLDDWPVAGFAFWDAYGEDPTGTTIEALIHALTPIADATSMGDFDFDGDVDAGDLVAWTREFGDSGDYQHYADADEDDDVDGADFLAWQRELGSPPATVAAKSVKSTVVPEPAALAALFFAVLRRRRKKSQPASCF